MKKPLSSMGMQQSMSLANLARCSVEISAERIKSVNIFRDSIMTALPNTLSMISLHSRGMSSFISQSLNIQHTTSVYESRLPKCMTESRQGVLKPSKGDGVACLKQAKKKGKKGGLKEQFRNGMWSTGL